MDRMMTIGMMEIREREIYKRTRRTMRHSTRCNGQFDRTHQEIPDALMVMIRRSAISIRQTS